MASPTDGKGRKILVLATTELTGPCIGRELHGRGIGADDEIKLVVPVLAKSRFAERVGEVDEERVEAEEHLQTSVKTLADAGFKVEGWVGDSDPVLAVEDAVAEFEFQTVIVATHPDSEVTFAEEDLAPHIAGRVELDLVHVVLDCDDEHPLHEVEEIEAEPLVEERMERRDKRQARDLLALFVAVLGTVLSAVLLFGANHLSNGDPQGVIQALLGVGVFFLTFWGGAQVLFGEAVNRRRGATGTVANIILVAVPVAVIISAILAIS